MRKLLYVFCIFASLCFSQVTSIPAASGGGGGTGNMTGNTGAGAPVASCTAGITRYLDTTNQDDYFCSAANTWKKTLSTSDTGQFLLTGQVGTAPSTPAVNKATLWFDSTSKTLKVINDAAGTSSTVSAVVCSAGQAVTSISASGVPTCAAIGGSTSTTETIYMGAWDCTTDSGGTRSQGAATGFQFISDPAGGAVTFGNATACGSSATYGPYVAFTGAGTMRFRPNYLVGWNGLATITLSIEGGVGANGIVQLGFTPYDLWSGTAGTEQTVTVACTSVAVCTASVTNFDPTPYTQAAQQSLGINVRLISMGTASNYSFRGLKISYTRNL